MVDKIPEQQVIDIPPPPEYRLLEVLAMRYMGDGTNRLLVDCVVLDESTGLPSNWLNHAYSPDDPVGISKEIKKWLEANPNAPIGDVVVPDVDPRSVDWERDRRTDGTFVFMGNTYQCRPQDRENIAGAATAALAAMMAGVGTPGNLRWHGGNSDFMWIDADNNMHPMDAQTMFALGQTAMAHKQAHIFAARALKDTVPIPHDYNTNEEYWP